MARLVASGPPLTVIDTHAGRGLYDLASVDALASGEAEAGIVRLMKAHDAPRDFAPLIAATRALNREGEVRRYPGSPRLIQGLLRLTDRYIGFELRRDEHAALVGALANRPNIQTYAADGYVGAIELCPQQGRVLVLIDPPFERPDDYDRIVTCLLSLRRRNPAVQALVWVPLKDLETLDGFVRELEDAPLLPLRIAECRVRPLDNPMRMNGCALVLLNLDGFEPTLSAITGWVARSLGERGDSRVYRLPPR
jgi:23S rRNA (adenine2030-N6)-methyltransferase